MHRVEAHDESARAGIHDLEVAKGGYEKAQHLKKDLAGIRSETSAVEKALHGKNYGEAALHAEKLGEKIHAFDKDLAAAKTFVREAKLEALHPHRGGTVAGRPCTSRPIRTSSCQGRRPSRPRPGTPRHRGANVTPLSHLRPGDHAAIGRWARRRLRRAIVAGTGTRARAGARAACGAQHGGPLTQ